MTDVLKRCIRYLWVAVVTPLRSGLRAHWCRGRDYIQQRPIAESILYLVALALVPVFAIGGADLMASRLFGTATMTVTAETDSVQFELGHERSLAWKLPPGRVMTLTRSNHPQCTRPEVGIGSVCEFRENTRLLVGHRDATEHKEPRAATVTTLQVSPDGELMISLSSADETCSELCIHAVLQDADGTTLLQDTRSLSFETVSANADDRTLRYPIIAGSAVLGSALHDAGTLGGDDFDFWQPVLHSGTVQILAQNYPGPEKYEVLSDTVAAGDVVELAGPATSREALQTAAVTDSWLFRTGVAGPTSAGTMYGRGKSGHTIWGMIEVLPEYKSVGHGGAWAADGDSDGRPRGWEYRMKVVLHTTLREIEINRFGASQPHTVKASGWSIIARWPNGQQGWVILVSVIVVLSFLMQYRDTLRCIRKDRKEKRAGAGEKPG